MKRYTYYCADIDVPRDDDGEYPEEDRRREIVHEDDPRGNLIGSRIVGAIGMHMPLIDVDGDQDPDGVMALIADRLPEMCEPIRHMRWVPSSTEGHGHIYVDLPMSWPRLHVLLRDLVEAGVIETGYFNASKNREQTFVRKPGVMRKYPRVAKAAV